MCSPLFLIYIPTNHYLSQPPMPNTSFYRLNGKKHSIDYFKTAVRHERFRYAYTVRCLVVFEQGCNYSRQCQSTAVERMAKLRLTLCSLVTTFEAVCLIALEVRHRRYLEPPLLRCRKHLEVERQARRKRHIAAAQT